VNQIAEYIKNIANQNDMKLHVCTVDSVNGSTCDVTPISGEAPFKKVRLNANINSDLGVVITPKTGNDKYVLVCEVSPVDAFVCMFSEIEKINIKIGQSEVLIKDDEISFNGGINHGMVKVDSMVNWMKKVYSDLQTLKGLLASIPVVAGVGSVTFVPSTPSPQENSFKNDKVKH
jgi:hypothetical protein